MIDWIRFLITACMVTAGLALCCIGVYGVFRFKYALNRMHAAAINDTLGVALCVLGFAVSAPDVFTALKLLLVVLFILISAPVSSHLLARLEMETNEERGDYMNVHEKLLNEEQEEAKAQEEEAQA